MEVRSQNELTGFGFAKDYDAVLTVHTEAGEQRFALEYERSPKPMRYYQGRRGLVESRSACEPGALPGLQL